MSQAYSNPDRESDPHALPDIEIFQLTAHEVAERDEDLINEYMNRREFRLAGMNSRTRDAMLDAICEEEGITGGWFYWYCFPGCMPDSDAIGPFDSHKEALDAAREDALS
jgi:hypothetical protein